MCVSKVTTRLGGPPVPVRRFRLGAILLVIHRGLAAVLLPPAPAPAVRLVPAGGSGGVSRSRDSPTGSIFDVIDRVRLAARWSPGSSTRRRSASDRDAFQVDDLRHFVQSRRWRATSGPESATVARRFLSYCSECPVSLDGDLAAADRRVILPVEATVDLTRNGGNHGVGEACFHAPTPGIVDYRVGYLTHLPGAASLAGRPQPGPGTRPSSRRRWPSRWRSWVPAARGAYPASRALPAAEPLLARAGNNGPADRAIPFRNPRRPLRVLRVGDGAAAAFAGRRGPPGDRLSRRRLQPLEEYFIVRQSTRTPGWRPWSDRRGLDDFRSDARRRASAIGRDRHGAVPRSVWDSCCFAGIGTC